MTAGICRVCGCTDERGCPDICWWVEPDLCSSCSRRMKPPKRKHRKEWTPDLNAEVERLWHEGLGAMAISSRTGLSPGQVAGYSTRAGLHHRTPAPEEVIPLRPETLARIGAHTVFVSRVVEPDRGVMVLKPGREARKLGDLVTKGAWKGMPIYSLTLEERATCPSDCDLWATCYGNAMPWAARNRHGPALHRALNAELGYLASRHREGFVVRLHTLGDFYSTRYVDFWLTQLARLPWLRVFGYTHWRPGTPIGDAVRRMVGTIGWARCAIRLSHTEPGAGRAMTLSGQRQDNVIPCPAQTGRTATCGTCALCWSLSAFQRTIGFQLHGKVRRRGGKVPLGTIRDHRVSIESGATSP